jgi:hypothetical protein
MRAVSREQRAESREQRAESREQRAESRESREQRAECGGFSHQLTLDEVQGSCSLIVLDG